MSLKAVAAKLLSRHINGKINAESRAAHDYQKKVFNMLLDKGKKTGFGQDHRLGDIMEYEDYIQAVPVRDFEALRPYVNRIMQGTPNVLWPDKPLYFAKTSGTTSGAKYIPITKDSMPNHINSARNMLLRYINNTGKASFVDGKMIFLSGSPELSTTEGILTGRLSGIVNHHVPGYLQKNRLPSYETNCIDDWEVKLEKVVEETIGQDMRLISGIPPWVQMYFDRIHEKTGKSIKEVFPNLQLLVHGGVNFSPYEAKLRNSIGGDIDILETFPASEGFFAFQDTLHEEGLLLNVNSGIFFEFIPVEDFHSPTPRRLPLWEVELGQNYVLIINSNAGLWAYNIGDTVKFVSKSPYRIVVTGRVKHFISAFGEHVIAQEVADALAVACDVHNCRAVEFTVAPEVNPSEGLPYHEWFIEFEQFPESLPLFADVLNLELCKRNSYYKDLIEGQILQKPLIRLVERNGFQQYMKQIGKLGGQNKVPKLGNDRNMADKLMPFVING